MKIGVCNDFENADLIKLNGYDHIEENMAKTASISDEEFEKRAQAYKELNLEVYSFNLFFPKGTELYKSDYIKELKEYLKKAIFRAHILGASICVIGSGWARKIPDGVSRIDAEKRFLEVISIVADEADKYGIKIAIEPLNSLETNYINTVKEAADVAKKTGRKNVGALVDFYHFYMEKEEEKSLIEIGDSIIHVHIARANNDRKMPKEEDLVAISNWTKLLKQINYQGRASIEASYDLFEKDICENKKYLEELKTVN